MAITVPVITAVLSLNGNDQDIDFPTELVAGPEAENDIDATEPGVPVVVAVLVNDTVVPGTTITSVTDPGNGTVAINDDGTITYTPDAGFTGTDTFDYTICDQSGLDGAGDTATNRGIFCSTATVSITVAAPPAPPTTTPTNPTTTPTTPAVNTPDPSSPTASPNSGATSDIPKTGSEIGGIQTIGLSILLVGLALWFVSRRRRPRGGEPVTRSNAWPAPQI